MSEYKKSVLEYFHNKAEDYDMTDNQSYWWFSDCLLWEVFKDNALNKLNKDFKFFDAGAGTGRWTVRILEKYQDASGLLVDFSADMLEQAKKKIEKNHWEGRTEVIEADLDLIDLSNKENQYDLAFSFHNVLGFVNNPFGVMRKMARVVKKGGYMVCLVPNLYHNIFFNLKEGNTELAYECFQTEKGRFTLDMPEMNMFTPNKLKQYYEELDIEIEGIYGFPVTLYPGFQETQLHGETVKIKNILENEEVFERLLAMELKLYKKQDAAGRGNQIIIIGKKK